MPSFRTATVTGVIAQRPGLQRLAVRMPDGSDARAYALTDLVGDADVGDQVVCNTTAVERGLGTGGWHVVHWNTSRDELVLPGPEHIMKLRYTSLQMDAGTSELDHPEDADGPLDDTPVVVCTLHSQMALVAMAFADAAPGRRLAYVMTDGAALPLSMSDLVANLAQRELLAGTVTAGHAFGGDLEAVSTASALGLARHTLGADAIVVAMGPGVVGTGTAMGTTAVEAAGLLDTAEARGGRPVLCVRVSEGDGRVRHAGVSHHVHTVLSLTRTRPMVADLGSTVATPHGPDALPGADPVPTVLRRPAAELMERAGVRVTTMGRGPDDDAAFFDTAAAAGVLAADLLS